MNSVRESLFVRLFEASAWEWAGLAVAITVLIVMITRVRSWLREEPNASAADHVMLSQMMELHRQGSLSDEEFRSIKGRLGGQFDGSPQPRTGEAVD